MAAAVCGGGVRYSNDVPIPQFKMNFGRAAGQNGSAARLTAQQVEQVLPGVWRWASLTDTESQTGLADDGLAGLTGTSPTHDGPNGSTKADLTQAITDRCGTGLMTADGLVLIDPPRLEAGALATLVAGAGPMRHIVLTSPRRAALAEPFRGPGVTVWVPAMSGGTMSGGTVSSATTPADAADCAQDTRAFSFADALPGGLMACELPAVPADAGSEAAGIEVALLWPEAGDGLLITGDILPVVGQVPVYYEGAAPPVDAYLDAIKALLAAEPGTLAPARQAPPDAQVIRATAYAAHLGSPSHARRAAPVEGPRFLMPRATRVLEETLLAPVVLRRPLVRLSGSAMIPAASDAAREWIADPFACSRCGQPNEPMPQTCGGPKIARLCPDCRRQQREQLPAARVMFCAGGCCTREGARAVASAFRQELACHGLADRVDVVPVSCLGECSIGPFVRVAAGTGEESPSAAAYRVRTVERARRYAADEGEVIDDESELVLSRFAALVQPSEAQGVVAALAEELAARE